MERDPRISCTKSAVLGLGGRGIRDESGYVTGAEIAIDGGVTATHAFGG